MGNTPLIATILLIGTLAIWFGIDAYLETKGDKFTISWAVAWGTQHYPIIGIGIALLLGIIIGHLWWPNFEYCYAKI